MSSVRRSGPKNARRAAPKAGTARAAKAGSARATKSANTGRTEAGARPKAEAAKGRGPRAAGPGWSGRDLLTPYILLAISMRRAHGYFIEQYLRSLGLAHVEMTTLYRTLRQLEREGLVRSAWEAQSRGPARRVYTLTESGRGLLDAGAGFLDGYRRAIDSFFGAYGRKTGGKERQE
jgi:poly-beta-hydroxybutyrate-responsive repressor